MAREKTIFPQFLVLDATNRNVEVVLSNSDETFALVTLIVKKKLPKLSYALICYFDKPPLKIRPHNSDYFCFPEPTYGFIKYLFESSDAHTIDDIQTQCLFVVQCWLNNEMAKINEKMENGNPVFSSEISEETHNLCALKVDKDRTIKPLPKWLKKNPDLLDDLILLSEGLDLENPIDKEGLWYSPDQLLMEYERYGK